MKSILFSTSLVALVQHAQAKVWKMASISDVHLFPDYDSEALHDYCWPADTNANAVANCGRYGCDTPEVLARLVLQKVKDENPDLDVVFLPGDIIAHGYSHDVNYDQTTASYAKILDITAQVADLFTEYFPHAFVLPTLGNNDTKYHY